MASFRAHCIEDIEVDAERLQSMIEHSLVGVTALVPHIGYDRAAKIAGNAHAQGLDVKHAALDIGLRFGADLFFGKRHGRRAVVLETVAAVPCMVGATIIHLHCLRRMVDDGWIRILMDEAENERMHLMPFVEIARPTAFERLVVLLAKGRSESATSGSAWRHAGRPTAWSVTSRRGPC